MDSVHKILIVDDDPINVEIFQEILEDKDYLLETADSGEQALKVIPKFKPDLILLDIMMPGIDGYEVCRRIRKNKQFKFLKIILVSGKAMVDERLEGYEAGADDYVSKPFVDEELEAKIRVFLRLKSVEEVEKVKSQALSRLNAVIENTPLVAVKAFDSQQVITQWNNVCMQIYGFHANQVLDRHLNEIALPQEFITETEQKLQKIIDTGKADPPKISSFQVEQGETRWLFSAMVPIVEQGKVAEVFGMDVDITKLKNIQDDRQAVVKKMSTLFDGVIRSLGMVMETRDSYTAAHQRRVADLARAIAIELELDKQSVQVIYQAGLLHDIGNMSVPAEILNKPGELTETEYELVMEHPTAGYKILEPLDSSLPLAEIVWQHHERQDGSGYPLGLIGDDILVGACIVAVAEVVEAMSAHRPHRPSLGLKAALEEVKNNKGNLFRSDVANACLKLFVTDGYKFVK